MPTQFNTGLPAVAGLSLQCCSNCGHINYPMRELCGNCLGDSLAWQSVAGGGCVQSLTELHYPLEKNFSQHLPWPIASVKLNVGPVVFAHLQTGLGCNDLVQVYIAQDEAGNRVLVASGKNTSASQWLKRINFKEIKS